jgi:uncharacterized protein involved in exopolysaccharide biosynthesis
LLAVCGTPKVTGILETLAAATNKTPVDQQNGHANGAPAGASGLKGLIFVEDDIDPREYLRLLASYWRPILGLGLAAAVAVAAIGYSLPPSYEAEALVSVAPAQYSLQFEGVAVGQPVPVRTYPDLALSSEILQEVFVQLRDRLPPAVDTLSEFRRMVGARPASDPSLLRLTVRGTNAALTAEIANTWAAIFTARAGQLVAHDETNLEAYEQQLLQAKSDMAAADAELAAFQASNHASLLTARLDSQQAALTDMLNREHQLALLVEDTEYLLARLQTLNATAPANLAEDLVLLTLMTRVYSGEMVQSAELTTQSSQPSWQIQLEAGQPLAGPSISDQRALAENLLSTLNARREQVASDVQALEPNILALQGALAEARVSEAELTRAQSLAESHYQALASKVEEVKIALRESENFIQVASRAVVPTEAGGRSPLLLAMLAGAVSMAFGAALALFVRYWKAGPVNPAPVLTRSTGTAD